MTPIQIGDITVSRIVELEGPNSPRFTASLFPELNDDVLAPHLEWLAPRFIDSASGLLVMSIHAFIVRTRHHTIVVDTCIGNDKNRNVSYWNQRHGPFLDDLKKAGVQPEAVDYVLCTHLHVDHVGWNTRLEEGRWVPTFPNAKYLFARDEWDYWQHKSGDGTGDMIDDSVRPIIDAGLAELVEGEHAIDDDATIIPTPGHTPGHVSLRLSSNGSEGVITGDMIHHPFQFALPEITSAFCVDPDLARSTRRAFLDRYAERDVTILGTHFPAPTAGRIVGHGDAWRFEG